MPSCTTTYAVVLGLQEQWDAAADAYRKALAANPLHAHARNNLGQILERRPRLRSGAPPNTARRSRRSRPSGSRDSTSDACCSCRGDTAQAIAEFEKLRQPVDAETPRYLFALSTALVRAGRIAEDARFGAEAQRLATEFGQTELARAIAVSCRS